MTAEFTENFKGNGLNSYFGKPSLPLFLITDTGRLLVYTNDCRLAPRPGYKLISLVMAR